MFKNQNEVLTFISHGIQSRKSPCSYYSSDTSNTTHMHTLDICRGTNKFYHFHSVL